jgi:hypothetical protein
VYEHQDLGEAAHADGSRILRPAVRIGWGENRAPVLGVLDSGSPVSIANADLFEVLGVDLERDAPLYEVPLSVGGGFEQTPVYNVELTLLPPTGDPTAEAVRWTVALGARRRWRLNFAVLFSQRGWFDRFPTRIDESTSQVEISQRTSGLGL